MKIAFGVDPGGLELRAGVLEHLRAMGLRLWKLEQQIRRMLSRT